MVHSFIEKMYKSNVLTYNSVTHSIILQYNKRKLLNFDKIIVRKI